MNCIFNHAEPASYPSKVTTPDPHLTAFLAPEYWYSRDTPLMSTYVSAGSPGDIPVKPGAM